MSVTNLPSLEEFMSLIEKLSGFDPRMFFKTIWWVDSGIVLIFFSLFFFPFIDGSPNRSLRMFLFHALLESIFSSRLLCVQSCLSLYNSNGNVSPLWLIIFGAMYAIKTICFYMRLNYFEHDFHISFMTWNSVHSNLENFSLSFGIVCYRKIHEMIVLYQPKSMRFFISVLFSVPLIGLIIYLYSALNNTLRTYMRTWEFLKLDWRSSCSPLFLLKIYA